jgi:hypothetical protein
MTREWGAESLRVSLFSNAQTRITDEDWQAVTAQTENYTRQSIAGGYIYSGKFEQSQLNLSGVNKRIDFVQSTILPATPTGEFSLPTLGSWESTRERFLSFTSSWIKNSKLPFVRVAFGAVLLCPAQDRTASYEILKTLLSSVSVDPEKMRELLYRVNWPSESKVIHGLMINRITNWSALELFLASMELGPSPAASASSQAHAVRLEVDHNTDAARSEPFSQDQVLSIYNELVSAAVENTTNGECP